MVDVTETQDSWSKSETLTYSGIIMLQVKKICDLGSQDLVGGYTTQKNRVIGDLVVSEEEYVVSVRDAFCNAIAILNALAVHKYRPRYTSIMDKQEKANAITMKEFYDAWYIKSKTVFKQMRESNCEQEEWYQEKILLYRELFEQLCGFLNVSGVVDAIGG